MKSTGRFQRQWRILICLLSRRNGQTLKELSAEVEVDQRTIRRDLDTLRQVGFALEERVAERGRKHWRVIDSPARVPIHFTWPEAVSLYLGRRLIDPLAGTEFWRAAQTAFGCSIGAVRIRRISLSAEVGIDAYGPATRFLVS